MVALAQHRRIKGHNESRTQQHREGEQPSREDQEGNGRESKPCEEGKGSLSEDPLDLEAGLSPLADLSALPADASIGTSLTRGTLTRSCDVSSKLR